jgi:hypothetical protein
MLLLARGIQDHGFVLSAILANRYAEILADAGELNKTRVEGLSKMESLYEPFNDSQNRSY